MPSLLDSWSLVSSSAASPGSVAVSSGSNRVLLYKVTVRTGPGTDEVTGVSYGGQTMTLVEEGLTAGPSEDVHSSIWLLDEAGIAAAGSTAFAITPELTGVSYRAHSAAFEDVDQADPVIDSFTALGEGGADPTSEEITTGVSGLVIAALSGADEDGGTQDVTWSNLTEQIETIATTVSYTSIAHAASDGSGFTPSLSISNNSNTVLQALSLRDASSDQPVILDAWTTVSTSAASAETGEEFVVSAGTNRQLVVAIGEDSTFHEPTAVAYGGEAMTLVGLAQSGGGFPVSVSFWILNDAGITAAADSDIVVTFNGTHDGQFRMFAASYENIKQTDPVINTHTAIGGGSVADPAVLDTVADGLALAMLSSGVEDIDVSWSGAAEVLELNATGTYHSIAAAATTGSELTITPSGASFSVNAFVAFSLAPAGDGAVITGIAPAATAAIAATVGNITLGSIHGIAPAAEAAIAGAATVLSGSIHEVSGSLDVIHQVRGEL